MRTKLKGTPVKDIPMGGKCSWCGEKDTSVGKDPALPPNICFSCRFVIENLWAMTKTQKGVRFIKRVIANKDKLKRRRRHGES